MDVQHLSDQWQSNFSQDLEEEAAWWNQVNLMVILMLDGNDNGLGRLLSVHPGRPEGEAGWRSQLLQSRRRQVQAVSPGERVRYFHSSSREMRSACSSCATETLGWLMLSDIDDPSREKSKVHGVGTGENPRDA